MTVIEGTQPNLLPWSWRRPWLDISGQVWVHEHFGQGRNTWTLLPPSDARAIAYHRKLQTDWTYAMTGAYSREQISCIHHQCDLLGDMDIPRADLTIGAQINNRYWLRSYAIDSVWMEDVSDVKRVVSCVGKVNVAQLQIAYFDVLQLMHKPPPKAPFMGMPIQSTRPYALRFLGDKALYLVGGQNHYMAYLLIGRRTVPMLVDHIPLTFAQACQKDTAPSMNFHHVEYDAQAWVMMDVLAELGTKTSIVGQRALYVSGNVERLGVYA